MALLNAKLYAALTSIFGEVKTAKGGMVGEFSVIPIKNSAYKLNRGVVRYASVDDWGENYNVCCPICKETRHRLSFSHLWGVTASVKNMAGGSAVEFGQYLCRCYNEECQRKSAFNEYRCRIKDAIDRLSEGGSVSKLVSMSSTVKFKKYTVEPYALPSSIVPVISERCPLSAAKYLEARGFDPSEIYEKYYVMYASAGCEYQTDIDRRKFLEDRLVIPIVQSTKIVSWQARRIFDGGVKKMKYLFPPGCRKSTYLYNMDNALFQRHIALVEGVTDVWRIGDRAVALFGKTMSVEQMEIIRCLWDYEASCVVIPDGDDEDALEKWERIAAVLRMRKIFKYGVGVCMLDKGKDPADYTRDEILGKIEDTERRK